MSDLTEAVPVQKWAVNLESLEDREAALEGWRSLVRAQGWSPVGEPEVFEPMGEGAFVIGRLVKYPGLTVSAGVTSAICVPGPGL